MQSAWNSEFPKYIDDCTAAKNKDDRNKYQNFHLGYEVGYIQIILIVCCSYKMVY